ncbi:MAG TPA: SDR family oxidoreductase [Polyangiales bacterium]|nr:SDR family oxidoreductase [Polyangiales bacterium]
MPSILITGANRGLGLEFAKQYAEAGYRVFATAREPDRATELASLAKRHTSLSVHALAPTDPNSVAALARELQGQPLDILLNNAGSMGPKQQSLGRIDYAGMLETFDINSIAPLRTAEAFLDNVSKSDRKLLVALTSGMGSIADTGGGSYAYRASKAALNMIYRNLAQDLKARGVIAVVINPGWVQTDMGGPGAPLRPADSIADMRKVLDGLTLADSGTFLDYRAGKTWPW